MPKVISVDRQVYDLARVFIDDFINDYKDQRVSLKYDRDMLTRDLAQEMQQRIEEILEELRDAYRVK